MKKFGMLIFSLIVFLSTISIYIYENTNLPHSIYREPEINFKSEKFGQIRNIIWGRVGNYNDYLFILADNAPNMEKNTSFIYYLNINTGKHGVLTFFKTNENFKSYMEYVQWQVLYAISKGEIFSMKASVDPSGDEVHCEKTFYPVPDLENVDSISISNQIIYTKSTDKLLYIQDMPRWGYSFNNFGHQIGIKTIYAGADKVIPSPVWGNIYFTRHGRDRINAYAIETRGGIGGVSQKFITKNFIYLRESFFQGGEFVTLRDGDSGFEIITKGTPLVIINKNTDFMGQIPDVQLKAVNNTFEVYYTTFNESHIGSIFSLDRSANRQTEIVKNQPIIGPMRFSVNLNDPKLLFFTYENGEIHVKTCNVNGDGLVDITELF